MNEPIVPQLRQFARYALTRELRREPSTTVYLALDPVMHREVVLKVVHLPPPSDATAHQDAQLAPLEQAFVRQAQAAGKLNHPHIVTVFEAGRLKNQGYLAIERVNGRSLQELVAAGWRPLFVHAASIAARVADAIEHAHAQNVAHGHLNARHVLLQADGVPKVEGFGGWIDNGAGGDDALHRTEKLLPYFQNELTDEMRSHDVRGVASLVYLMVGGKAPGAAPPPLASLRADVPPALARLVDDTLNPPPGHAHRSAADLRDGLTAFIWNERKENVAPATLGIPLAAPPRQEPPSPIAPRTVDSTPAQRDGAVFSKTVQPERPRTVGKPAAVRAAPSPRSAAAPKSVRAAAARAAPATARPSGLATLRAQALPWLRGNRVGVGVAVGFVVVAVIIATLLATFAGHQVNPSDTAAAAAPPPPAAAAPPPLGDGVVMLDIQPWGEIIVDGKPIGVSPPMSELRLPAGRHAVEIRYGRKDGETAAVTAQIDVDPGKAPLQIKHRFE